MRNLKSFVFNNCKLAFKISPLLICGFLFVCCRAENANRVLLSESQIAASAGAVNINDVPARELEKLPHIGATTAQKIVEFREKYGKFRKPEHLLLIDGISDKRFREMKSLIKVE